MTTPNVRSWLRRQPQPHSCRVKTREGTTKTVALPEGARRWAKAEATLAALDPDVVEALDHKGNVLRAFDTGHPPDDEDDEEPDSPSILDASKDVHPPSRIVEMSRIVADVSDRAAARHENAYKQAFDMLVHIVTTMSARLEGMEKAWTQMLNLQTREVAKQKPKEPEDEATAMIMELLKAKMMNGGGGLDPSKMSKEDLLKFLAKMGGMDDDVPPTGEA
jgi:hypothetical protein